MPYVMAEDLKSNYALVKERVHTCERCGRDMHMFTEGGAQRVVLKCPDCGGRLERSSAAIMWD